MQFCLIVITYLSQQVHKKIVHHFKKKNVSLILEEMNIYMLMDQLKWWLSFIVVLPMPSLFVIWSKA